MSEEMRDVLCAADGETIPAMPKKEGGNLNTLITGGTGSGKTFSVVAPTLVHTHDSSVVVTMSKNGDKKAYMRMFEDRGYKVFDIDFTDSEGCNAGYDPLDNIETEEDITRLAEKITDNPKEETKLANNTMTELARNIITALITLVMIMSEEKNERPHFTDFINLFNSLKIKRATHDDVITSLDQLFSDLDEPGEKRNLSERWKTIISSGYYSLSSAYSFLGSVTGKIFTESVKAIADKGNRISIKELGEEKTALFITTSPVNPALQKYVDILYSDIIKILFEAAEKEGGSLKVPVHLICDDFACGSKIYGFDEHISIFRAAGLRATILLQSESQLKSIYGEYAATTIINNCDTYIYMGGMDSDTCFRLSQKTNKPLHRILELPREEVIVLRRGEEAKFEHRYRTLEDPEYIAVMSKYKEDMEDSEERGL